MARATWAAGAAWDRLSWVRAATLVVGERAGGDPSCGGTWRPPCDREAVDPTRRRRLWPQARQMTHEKVPRSNHLRHASR